MAKIKTAQDLPAGFSIIAQITNKNPNGVSLLEHDIQDCWDAFENGFQADDTLHLRGLQDTCDNCVAHALHINKIKYMKNIFSGVLYTVASSDIDYIGDDTTDGSTSTNTAAFTDTRYCADYTACIALWVGMQPSWLDLKLGYITQAQYDAQKAAADAEYAKCLKAMAVGQSRRDYDYRRVCLYGGSGQMARWLTSAEAPWWWIPWELD